MTNCIALSIILVALTAVTVTRWVLPGGTIAIEASTGSVHVTHNGDEAFRESGVSFQIMPDALIGLPEYRAFTNGKWSATCPLWWLPAALWLVGRVRWLLGVMFVVDLYLIVVGILITFTGVVHSGQPGSNRHLILMAIGIPLVVLGIRGIRAILSYRRDRVGMPVIINIWFSSIAWILGSYFGGGTMWQGFAIAVLALIITLSLKNAPVEAAGDESMTEPDHQV